MSRASHLQHVQPLSLILLPLSGSCSETNGHRCGHICQQHRARVIHRYGEFKPLLLPFPPLPSTHISSLSDISIITHKRCHYSSCIWRWCGQPQLLPRRSKPGNTGADALFTSCGSARIKQMSEFKIPGGVISIFLPWKLSSKTAVSPQRVKDLVSGLGITNPNGLQVFCVFFFFLDILQQYCNPQKVFIWRGKKWFERNSRA